MKVYLCGQKHFGAAVLDAMKKSGHDVRGVSCPRWANERIASDDEKGHDLREDKLFIRAAALGVPWRPAGSVRGSTLPEVDLIVCAHSHDFISKPARQAARLGAIGFHPSLLPLHRGRDAIRWAVHMRDRVTGGSVYWLTDHVDGGPIAAQDWCFIRPEDTAESLWRRELSPMGVRLILKVLADLDTGRIVKVAQDHKLATWEPQFGSPPIHRPELPQIGEMPDGYHVTIDRQATVPDEPPGPAVARAAMYGIHL